MPGVGDGNGPSYISAHSADVILSDIRPIKLKNDALRAINALLDEFLSRILSISCSLATDKLRASLLSLLPTSLGKEALLEAEVELRAYWERTESKASIDVDDSRTFHQEWAFELLRQKCEAYSTLNEEDEDPTAESRINERFGKSHPHPPSNALLDPAALYLTAILESMCEHVLSNVGRVAARDSSRTIATVNDLFIALCEDDSIYGLFRMMKMYDEIELMSKTPKARRSKSFTRSDKLSISRTSSPQRDSTTANPPSASKSRQSFDGQSITAAPSTAGSRASFEKARAIRMFSNGKPSAETETLSSGHKKSESVRSESLKSFPDDETLNPAEDAAMLREFDDLMRSASTMKVSLTPDRLKTMEVYKQEKDHRSAVRRPGTHFSSNSEPEILSASRANSQRPSLRHVDSIVEDDEEQNSPKARARKGSNTVPPVPPLARILPVRTRSVSTSNAIQTPSRKLVRTSSTKAAPSSFSQADSPSNMVQTRDVRYNRPPQDNNGFPARTRVRQRNRDSLDLDDVMNGSDDDQEVVDVPVRQQVQSPQTPKCANHPSNKPAVSSKTRELMDFLAEGPPEPPQSQLSKNGRDFVDFLAEGPPDYGSNPSIDPMKPKGAGRLQRMISKLNLGNGEKAKTVPDGPKTPHSKQPPTPVRPNVINNQAPLGALANRPIPPRPPPSQTRLISPPSSPHDSSDENKSMHSVPRKPYQDNNVSRDPSFIDKSISANASPVIPAPPVPQSPNLRADAYNRSTPPVSNRVYGNGNLRNERVPKEVLSDVQPLIPVRNASFASPTRKPVPSVVSTSTPSISEPDLRDMQRLLGNASSADECRLIVDMFMARNGIPRVPKTPVVPYPSPSPSVVKHTPYVGGEASLETSLVELFLGGTAARDLSQQLPPTQDNPIDGMPGQIDEAEFSVPQHDSIHPDVPISQGPHAIPLRA